MLSIGADCRKISHYGIGNVVRAILCGLIASDFKVTAFGNPSEILKFFPKIRVIPFYSHHNNPFAYMGLRTILEKNPEFDCWISPHYVGVWPLRVKLDKGKRRIPILCYLHDLIHLSWPSNFMLPWLSKLSIKNMIRSSDLVVTPSDYTREVAKMYGFNTESWQTLSPPVSAEFLEYIKSNPRDDERSQSGDAKNYYLCVTSSLKPHKGISNLLKIWRPDYPKLKLVGNVQQLRDSTYSNIEVIPDLSTADLVSLYKAAKWIVVPSLDEGFGYVYLESRYTYTPVISRPIPCFKEFKASCDLVAENLSDESLQTTIERSFKATPEIDRSEFEVIQAKFDQKAFTAKLSNLVEWLCNASNSS